MSAAYQLWLFGMVDRENQRERFTEVAVMEHTAAAPPLASRDMSWEQALDHSLLDVHVILVYGQIYHT